MKPRFLPHLVVTSGTHAAAAVQALVDGLARDGQKTLRAGLQLCVDEPAQVLRVFDRLRSEEYLSELRKAGFEVDDGALSRLLVFHLWDLPADPKQQFPTPLSTVAELRRQVPSLDLVELVFAADGSDAQLRHALTALREKTEERPRRYVLSRHNSRGRTYGEATLHAQAALFLRLVLFGTRVEDFGQGEMAHPGRLTAGPAQAAHAPLSLLGAHEIAFPSRDELIEALASAAMRAFLVKDAAALSTAKEKLRLGLASAAADYRRQVEDALQQTRHSEAAARSAITSAGEALRQKLHVALTMALRPPSDDERVQFARVATLLADLAAELKLLEAKLPDTILLPPPPQPPGFFASLLGKKASEPEPPIVNGPVLRSGVSETMRRLGGALREASLLNEEFHSASGEAWTLAREATGGKVTLHWLPEQLGNELVDRILIAGIGVVGAQLARNAAEGAPLTEGLLSRARETARELLPQDPPPAFLMKLFPKLADEVASVLEGTPVAGHVREGKEGPRALAFFGEEPQRATTARLAAVTGPLSCDRAHYAIELPAGPASVGVLLVVDDIDPAHLLPYFKS